MSHAVRAEPCTEARRYGGLAALSLSLLLLSCAPVPPGSGSNIPKYVAPKSGETARLILRGLVQPKERYGAFIFNDAQGCKEVEFIGSGGSNFNPESTHLVANRLTTLQFMTLDAQNRSCRVTWTFTPGNGKSYLLSGALHTNSCSSRLLDASDPDNMRVPADLLQRNTSTQLCVPTEQSRKMGSGGNKPSGETVLSPNATTDDLKDLIGK